MCEPAFVVRPSSVYTIALYEKTRHLSSSIFARPACLPRDEHQPLEYPRRCRIEALPHHSIGLAHANSKAIGRRRQQMAAFRSMNGDMTILATALLLASSLVLSSPGYVEQTGIELNPMLRNAAVDHDLAKVKRRFERELRSDSTDSPGASTGR